MLRRKHVSLSVVPAASANVSAAPLPPKHFIVLREHTSTYSLAVIDQQSECDTQLDHQQCKLSQEASMKLTVAMFAAFALSMPVLGAGRLNGSHPVHTAPLNKVLYVQGSTQKVCQLTGEKDKEFNTPTASQTESRFGLIGTDRGYSFEHNGKLFFLFGDTPPTATFNGRPNSQTDAPRDTNDNDAIAFMDDSSSQPIVKLDFVTDSIGAFKNPVVLNALGQPAITLRTNETPIAGISDNGRMFVLFGTDNFLSNPPGGTSSPNGGATRTVAAVSDDNGVTFHFLYNFSKGPGAKFVYVGIANGNDGYLYFWGTEGDSLFRKSPPFLARKPVGSMNDSTAIEYFHGTYANGTPMFTSSEGDAVPLFHDSLPAPGGGMQVADCMGEVGVQWNPYTRCWVMLYNSADNSASNPHGIWMRTAKNPWGPWSAPQTIFNPATDNGLCYFIHRAVTNAQPACDSLSGTNRLAIQGGDYAPYFIDRFTTGDAAQGTSTFFFVMSTWNPYEVVIMQSSIQVAPVVDTAGIPKPAGLYVLDEQSNEKAASADYAAGLTSSPAYQDDIAGHAIFVPIAKILPSITTWGQFSWTWGYVDTLVDTAVAHGKKFSIELETGFQSGSTYLQALPAGFRTLAGDTSAPLFDVWITGGTGGRGISAYIPLPWNQKVQEFWSAAAFALAAHLQDIGAYGSLTLVHIPGLSVYDEELRLPTGLPAPPSTDTSHCPDGRLSVTAVAADADTARWRSLGYSDSAVVDGFCSIATAFAEAFPDRYLALSLFSPGAKGIDFPNLTGDTLGTVAYEIVKQVNAIAPGRVLLQADLLDANLVLPEVTNFASDFADRVGWQSNKHAGTGAGCNGGGIGSCSPDGPTSPYFQLLQNGWQTGGRYLEVWSADVIDYPASFAAALSSGYFTTTSVSHTDTKAPTTFDLQQNYPNPFNPSTTVSFSVASRSHVLLTVYDELGRTLATLVDGELNAGTHRVVWNGGDDDGRKASSGIYFLRLQAGPFSQTRKMILIK